MLIHIIDDNVDITTMLAKYFAIKGHSCSVSNDGRNGLSMILANPYDVILLDLAMPDFSGMDLVEELHRTGKIQKLNVVALTASSVSREKDEHLKKRGVKAVLRKPIDPDLLLETLQQLARKV